MGFFIAEQLVELGFLVDQIGEFLFQLHFFEAAQRAQTRVQNRFGLIVGQGEGLDQGLLGFVLLADDFDHPVEIEIDNQQAADDFQTPFDLVQPVLRPPVQHHAAMVEPFAQGFGQAEDFWHQPCRQHVHVHRNAAFKLGQLEQRFHQQDGIDGARARLEHHADIFGRFIADIGQKRQFLVIDQFGDFLDQPRFGDKIGNFGDNDDPATARQFFLVPARADAEAAASGAVGLGNALAAFDDHPACGEIGAGHEIQQLIGGRLRMADQIEGGIAQFGGIMGRDRGRHAHRNALRAIGQQVGEGGGQHHRLFFRTVIGLAEIDRILVQPFENETGDFGQPRFGVTHGCGIIAVDIAEIALSVDQRITLGKILRQTHQRIIDRLVAMRMVLTDHIADHAGAFFERRAGIKLQQAHGIEQAAMDRLQPVARIGQGTVHNRRQRISEVTLLERITQIHTGHTIP